MWFRISVWVVKYYWHDCLVTLPCKGICQTKRTIHRVSLSHTWVNICLDMAWALMNQLAQDFRKGGWSHKTTVIGLLWSKIQKCLQFISNEPFLLKTLQRWRSQPFPGYSGVEFWMWTMLLDFCSIQGIPEVQTNMISVVFPLFCFWSR